MLDTTYFFARPVPARTRRAHQQAKFACQYKTKSGIAYVEGRLQARIWEPADGSNRRTVQVVAEKLKAISPQPTEQAA